MKYVAFLVLALMSFSAFAATKCKPIYDAPVIFSVSGRLGHSSMTANQLSAVGNKLSPVKPSERYNFLIGGFAFHLTPLSSCEGGLLLNFQRGGVERQVLVPWGHKTAVAGKVGSNYYVVVIARKEKP